jgi:hypothetical protein
LWWAVRLQVGIHGFVLPLRSLLPFFAVCNHV